MRELVLIAKEGGSVSGDPHARFSREAIGRMRGVVFYARAIEVSECDGVLEAWVELDMTRVTVTPVLAVGGKAVFKVGGRRGGGICGPGNWCSNSCFRHGTCMYVSPRIGVSQADGAVVTEAAIGASLRATGTMRIQRVCRACKGTKCTQCDWAGYTTND